MIEKIDLGLIPYKDAWDIQKSLFQQLVDNKKMKKANEKEYLLFAEHTPVITLGFHADESNILLPEEYLKDKNIDRFRIERGGDVTFHGPGQLVVYPILDLENHGLGVKQYVRLLEETVILILKNHGVKGVRIENAPGVWIKESDGADRKICALGIKCSRFCTMHGIGFNINTDLSYFNLLNPCGFKDKGVTSLKQLKGKEMKMEELKNEFSDIFFSLIFSL